METTNIKTPHIERNPMAAQSEEYDVIVVGGGIYGCMVLLHLVATGLKCLLVDRSDFGSATSFNSLRIMHGGLRFLKRLDITRSRHMIEARAWLLRHFPDLVRPMPCLMPLYNRGIQRKSTLRAALAIDNLLCRSSNSRLASTSRISPGRIVSRQEVLAAFPLTTTNGLLGGAVWEDAQLEDSPRLIVETLRWATALGGTALNYVEADQVLTNQARVCGIAATDRLTGSSLEFSGRVVVNAAGPWCRGFARAADRDVARLFQPSLAWNLLLDRPQLSDHAVALTCPTTAHTYFIVPWKGKMLAGTGHRAVESTDSAGISEQLIATMLDDLNACVPNLNLERSNVAHVFSGFLPVKREGSNVLSERWVMQNHADRGGPQGLISVSGVKFVAAPMVARQVADSVISAHFPDHSRPSTELPPRPAPNTGWANTPENDPNFEALTQLARSEAVTQLSDLVLRRTSMWTNPQAWSAFPRIAEEVCGNNTETAAEQVSKLKSELASWDISHA